MAAGSGKFEESAGCSCLAFPTRILSGNRALLIVDVPMSYQNIRGHTQLRVSGSASLLYPLTRRWTVEPRRVSG